MSSRHFVFVFSAYTFLVIFFLFTRTPPTSAQSSGPAVPIDGNSANAALCATVVATWSSWSSWTPCQTTCGACSQQQQTRTCASPNALCTCSGAATNTQFCNIMPCVWPKTSCCNGFIVTSWQGQFACMATSTFTGSTQVTL